MKRIDRWFKLVAVTLLFMLTAACCEAKEVRLGVVNNVLLPAYGISGEYKRNDWEYLNEIAERAGWEYKIVDYREFTTAVNGLQNGEIDLLGGVRRLDMDWLVYADRPTGRELIMFLTGKRGDMKKSDFINKRQLSVGITSGRVSRADVDKYLQHYGVPIFWHEYSDSESMFRALSRGELDIVAGQARAGFDSMPVIDYFWLDETYYVAAAANAELIAEFNKADAYIVEHQPGIVWNMQSNQFDNRVLLSKAELDFLRQHKTFRVGLNDDQWPRSYYDAEDKTFKGYYVELLQNLAAQLGIEFEFVPLTEGTSLEEFFADNPETAVFGLEDMSPELTGQDYYISRPILASELQFVCHEENLPPRDTAVRVILPQDKVNYENVIRQYYPQAEFMLTDNIEACLDAISDRKADLSLYNAEPLRNFMQLSNYEHLQMITAWTLGAHIVMAAPSKHDYYLITALDKAVTYLNATQVDSFAMNDVFASHREFTLVNFWYEYRIYIVSVIFCWLLTLIVMYYHFRLRMSKHEHYRNMAEMSGAIFFEYDVRENEWYYSDGFEKELGRRLDKDSCFLDVGYIHDSEAEGVWEQYRELVEGKGDVMELKARLLNGDGSYVWYEIYAKLVHKDSQPKLVGNIKNINNVMNDSEKLKALASTDRLSGLLNKNSMLEQMELYLSDPDHKGGVLFFIDIDNFKQVNDKMGHTIGDSAIRDISQKIKALFRSNDLMGRFGGDEFFVFSQSLPLQVINERSRQLVAILRSTYINDMLALKISASIGIAMVQPGEQITVSELLEKADKAAYVSKNRGKDRYTIYTDDLVFDGYEGNR